MIQRACPENDLGAPFLAFFARSGDFDSLQRTPPSAAFDLNFDFDREGHEFHSCHISANQEYGFSR